jgi:hypothetical protein
MVKGVACTLMVRWWNWEGLGGFLKFVMLWVVANISIEGGTAAAQRRVFVAAAVQHMQMAVTYDARLHGFV